ncbi:DUF6916 family protein [Skermanella pratensis]|uniref:DUF6916 family protein n=1 Tax=Skermanella pratensis TaxID=2233999 RepID=UPI0013011537|nr:hypothetical protein [Skermanella pratensis]
MDIKYFKKQVGNIFVAAAIPRPVELRLIRVREGEEDFETSHVPFTLTFANPSEERLSPGIYQLTSEDGLEFAYVALIPVARTEPVQQYLAEFT